MALKLGFEYKADSESSENIDMFFLAFLAFREEANLSDEIINNTKGEFIIPLFFLKTLVRRCQHWLNRLARRANFEEMIYAQRSSAHVYSSILE